MAVKRVRGGRFSSLRTRMLLGLGLIAFLALLAASALLYTAYQTAQRIDEVVAAERRIELYGNLSGRISDYAVVTIEATNATEGAPETRAARVTSRRDVVNATFDRIEGALAEFVAEALDENEANRRASWSLGLARMRAQFNALARTVDAAGFGKDTDGLRARLDGFATQFSPLLNAAIRDEQRQKSAAFSGIEQLRRTVSLAAIAIGALVLASFVLFQAGLVSPLLRRIGRISLAAREIGAGRLNTRLDVERHDELGLLFANVNRMAARLDRRRREVDADRTRLNEIVDNRTEALRHANAALERIDSNRRRFFSDVSHELRTPLTVILGETEIGLRSATLSEEETRASLAVIRARARRLNRRIEDLLRIARSESGRLDLAQRPFSVCAVVEDAIEDIEGLARRRDIDIRTELSGTPQSLGDADWTRQIVSGVLENALRHSQEGASVLVRLDSDGHDVSIRIIDEGEGIAASDLARVFKRFDRGERMASGTGFGVGLALARWVMETQGGGIKLKSPAPDPLSPAPRGLGTEAILTLPELLEASE